MQLERGDLFGCHSDHVEGELAIGELTVRVGIDTASEWLGKNSVCSSEFSEKSDIACPGHPRAMRPGT